MHYYEFNIPAWALHTSHLTLEEEGVYRRLLDHYYDTEKPIPEETKPVIRRLRLVNHEDIVSQILSEFFHLEADGWHNNRADIVIAKYQANANKARENGKKGGRPKQNHALETQPVILVNPDETESKANYKQLTINNELETKNKELINNPKHNVPKNKFSDDDFKCAEWLSEKLREFIPDCKKPNLNGWAKSVRDMRELDKRDLKEICQIWLWCRKDSFEAANVQSPEKLRKRYDQLKTKMQKLPSTGGSYARPQLDNESTDWVRLAVGPTASGGAGEQDLRWLESNFPGVGGSAERPGLSGPGKGGMA